MIRLIFSALLLTMIGCSSSPKQENPARHTAAVANSDEDQQIMESHFQALMNGRAPEQEMIDYVDQLYSLLIQVNKGIDSFEHQLDVILAKMKKNNAEVAEPTDLPVYRKLLKMWSLRDSYQSEIQYFYLRLLQTRTDETLSKEARMKARTVQQNVSTYLANMVDLQRVELQPLMKELREVFESFTTVYKEEQRAKRGQTSPAAPEEWVPPGFNEAIFGTQEALEAYIRKHKQMPKVPATRAERARQKAFLDKIDRDLGLMPDPVKATDRDPQSVVQDLDAKPGKQIYVDAGVPGNMIGANFPKNTWAFTFDDGPAVQSTSDMLDVLKGYHDSFNPVAKATFFWLARNAPRYPQWVKKAHDLGYPFENHSFTHADLAKQSSAGRRHEIFDANNVLTTEYRKVDPNYVIQYFRCPYGSCFAPKVPEVRQMLVQLKEVHVYWRIDSLDWKLLNGPRVRDLVIKQIQILNHGIVLMHDIHPTTVTAFKLVLDWLKDQNDNHKAGYKMVTIPEAVDLVNGTK